MKELTKKIMKLCSNGVEYRKIKDVYQRLRGTPITAAKMKEISNESGEIKIFAGGKTVINAKEKDIPNANITRVPAVLVQSRGVLDVVYYDKPFTFKNEMWAYTSSDTVSVKFLYYVLKNNIEYFREAASGMGSLPQISLPVTEEFKIPVPPLPVQAEIVRILDNFTELTAELTARKKQYEYYCYDIINRSKNTIPTRIGDMGKWFGGVTPSMNNKEFWDNGTIPWISSKDMKGSTILDTKDHIAESALSNTSIKLLPKNSIAIVARSGILKHTLPIVFIPIKSTINQDIKALVTNKDILPKYAYYALVGNQGELLSKSKKQGGTVDSLDISKFMDYKIPVPPLEEQERIVSILDRFDKLCNDISEGLPAEIAARQKQYEYYRDKLLTFNVKE